MSVSGVVPDDVATSLGRSLSSTEEAQADQWIGDAELQIRLRLGDLLLLDDEALAFVVREAVTARMRNPDARQYEAIDDYRYGLPAESRKVAILDEWWAMLSPANGGSAFTIPVSSPLDLA